MTKVYRRQILMTKVDPRAVRVNDSNNIFLSFEPQISIPETYQ